MKLEIRMTGSFDGDHARTDWVFRMTDFFEQATFQRGFDSLKHFSAKTFRMFFRWFYLHIEISHIHFFVRFFKTVSAIRNRVQALSNRPSSSSKTSSILLRADWISFFTDNSSILNLNGCTVLFDLFDKHPDSLKDVERFKTGDHSRSAKLFCDELIRISSQ